jgi:hypothetical protein
MTCRACWIDSITCWNADLQAESKSEIRNPKSETNSNTKEENPKRENGLVLDLGVGIWVLFRISDFGFALVLT